ncbi:MAG TPA: 50S ribosomal protein L32 [Bacillota bacterium]|nr:50S ribosomal protein L32 [Candidatus Fermentithermobacillaceae bacterium]HOB30082.1 50S ribosomal protein L32 [Bacillota bacterium]HOK63972.1 50S ribosomal protein L32 [Bacillota bacterium]HOL11327.1 50S ribosomal protein L32 [Bacillota bacterium]HOQ02456.1 50S ribosomal protein L32 [Bacillota bacterium]
MAVPKRRTSASKRDKRRASAWKNRLASPQLVECPRCHSLILPHKVCPDCGYYKGRQVMKVKAK